jgi:hypothetical protein
MTGSFPCRTVLAADPRTLERLFLRTAEHTGGARRGAGAEAAPVKEIERVVLMPAPDLDEFFRGRSTGGGSSLDRCYTFDVGARAASAPTSARAARP